jgi:N-acetylglucosaminyldiphosphoundecaprenol N-acetyl-beta-D-mannosaminyltransferase
MEGCQLTDRGHSSDDRTDILGVKVSAITVDDAVATIGRWIGQGTRTYVCVTGVHGVMESRSDETLRQIHNHAGLVTPDGMPLVWISRLRGKTRVKRVYGPDLMRRLTRVSALRGYKQFYFGGAEGVADRLKQAMIASYPDLEVVGTFCPPFREMTAEEDEAVVGAINAARPDIVWVGLSTPKQEYWMAGHLDRVEAPVMIGVGAAFDFLAGLKRQAPIWMQRSGLEWLFRLCSEPRRLWRRSARIVPGFLFLVTCDALRGGLRPSRAARTARSASQ